MKSPCRATASGSIEEAEGRIGHEHARESRRPTLLEAVAIVPDRDARISLSLSLSSPRISSLVSFTRPSPRGFLFPADRLDPSQRRWKIFPSRYPPNAATTVIKLTVLKSDSRARIKRASSTRGVRRAHTGLRLQSYAQPEIAEGVTPRR